MTHNIDGIVIRPMEERDLEKVLEYINIEGWNYHISEIERILRVSPGTSIVACHGETIVGGITGAVTGDRCVLGHVVMESGWRRKGIGSLLIESLLKNPSSKAMRLFDVYSIKNAIPFYRRHGFHHLEDIDTYLRKVTDADQVPILDPNVRVLKEMDLENMYYLDRDATGLDRKRTIMTLFKDFPGMSFGLFEDKALIGFIQGRETSVSCDIGPWTMKNPDVNSGKKLLRAILSKFNIGGTIVIGVPARNEVAGNVLKSCDFKAELFNFRLIKCDSKVEPFNPGMMALCAFELG